MYKVVRHKYMPFFVNFICIFLPGLRQISPPSNPTPNPCTNPGFDVKNVSIAILKFLNLRSRPRNIAFSLSPAPKSKSLFDDSSDEEPHPGGVQNGHAYLQVVNQTIAGRPG